MSYPGRAVRRGDSRKDVVRQVQQQLLSVGCGPLAADGDFGDETESSIKLFQTRRELIPDGVIGPLTWNELFEEAPAVDDKAPTVLLGGVLDVARTQIGIRETKGQRNRGAEVDQYVERLGLDPANGYSWCQAFVYWCFDQTASKLSVPNPCVKTAGVLNHWQHSPAEARLSAKDAFDDPTRIRPGAVFIVDHGGGKGHTGIVTKVEGGEIHTVEGNTNERGSREGDGVYAKTRAIGSINVGFIDYGLQ